MPFFRYFDDAAAFFIRAPFDAVTRRYAYACFHAIAAAMICLIRCLMAFADALPALMLLMPRRHSALRYA